MEAATEQLVAFYEEQGKYDDIYKIGKDFGTENKHCTYFGYSGYKKL